MRKKILTALVLTVAIMGIVSLNAFATETTVATVDGTNYASLTDALAAINDGSEVTIFEGEYADTLTITQNNVTIEGDGEVIFTSTPTFKGTNYYVENINFNYTNGYNNLGGSGIIKNCNFTASENTFRYCYGATNGNITFDSCNITAGDTCWAIHFDDASNSILTISNCSFTGKVALAANFASVTFEATSFNNGYVNTWGSANGVEFTDCEFNNIPYVFTGYSAENTVEFNNCTVDDGNANITDILYGGLDSVNTVIFVNGQCATKVAKIGETYYTNLADALQFAVSQPGNTTVEILSDIDFTNTVWVPVSVTGCGTVTVNGNDKILSGLTDMLFSSTWAGNSGLIINDLTIANSNIVHDSEDETETKGVGAFCGFPQASETIILNNCHLIDSSVTGGHWTGGLIGYAAGYSGNDGPVFETVTINNCSVKNSSVTGKGSVGGIIGHSTGDSWTKVIIDNATVENNTIISTGSSSVKAGAICGTVGCAGQPKETNGITKTGGLYISANVMGNTVTSNEALITTLYGRQGNSNGTLEITGGIYDITPFNSTDTFASIISGAYSITFDINGGTGTNIKVMITDTNGKLSYLPDAQKERCSFSGWYSESDTKATTETIFTEDTTLIARYSSNTPSKRPITNKLPATTSSVTDNTDKPEQPADTSKTQIILTIGKTEASVFGELKANDVAPKLVNDRTMLPARFVAESLGATVTWTETEPNKVLITKDDIEIIIYIGSDKAYVNGEEITLDSPAFLENDRTYTPIRFISEELGADVKWNDELQQVIITKK